MHINTWGADKSLARPSSQCILFDGENISFDASLVIYINSTNIPPLMITNRICETQPQEIKSTFQIKRCSKADLYQKGQS